jgi:hypothetical protein
LDRHNAAVTVHKRKARPRQFTIKSWTSAAAQQNFIYIFFFHKKNSEGKAIINNFHQRQKARPVGSFQIEKGWLLELGSVHRGRGSIRQVFIN